MMSETDKYRHLTQKYCQGNGVDIGSQGDPVVPWAIQVELTDDEFRTYSGNEIPMEVEWRGNGLNLPFKDGMLDFVYSSHLLEDMEDWLPALREWLRVLKPGGYLVILLPDRERWKKAVERGQPPNLNHRHEGSVGELSGLMSEFPGVQVIEDRLTDLTPEDYSVLFVANRL